MNKPRPRVTLIVARAANGVIGLNNALPWHIPEELQHFKRSTMGHALIMGRLTFESIGRALPGRRSIVVSRNPQWSHPGCERAASVEAAVALAASVAPDRPDIATDEVFVAGGAQIFQAAGALADRILMTEVALEPQGDVFMPAPDPACWQALSRQAMRSSAGIDFTIIDYRRIVAGSSDSPEAELTSGSQ